MTNGRRTMCWLFVAYLMIVILSRPAHVPIASVTILAVGLIFLSIVMGWYLTTKPELGNFRIGYAFLIIWTEELLSYTTSQYRRNSLDYLVDLALLTSVALLYVLIYIPSLQDDLREVLFVGTSIAAILISLYYLKEAITIYTSFKALHFADYSPLKTSISARCGTVNDWASIALSFLPFATQLYMITRKRWAACLGLVSSLLLNAVCLATLSRGAYASLIVFYAVLMVFKSRKMSGSMNHWCQGWMVLASSLVMITAVFRSLGPVLYTIRISETPSQVRSILGRMEIWKAAISIFEKYPITGVGQNNFGMKYVTTQCFQTTNIFVSRPPNLFLHVMAERGLVITATYGIIAGFIFYKLFMLARNEHRTCDSCNCSVQLAGVCAIFVHEMMYTSLFSNQIVEIMFSLILIVGLTKESPSSPSALGRCFIWGGVCSLMLVVCFWVTLQMIPRAIAARHYERALRRDEVGDLWRAREELASAIYLDKDNAYYAQYNGLLIARGIKASIGWTATGISCNLPEANDQKYVERSIAEYERSLSLNKDDIVALQNLAWLYTFRGDLVHADAMFKNVTALSNSGVYYVSYGMFLECSGRQTEAFTEYWQALVSTPEIAQSQFYIGLHNRNPGAADSVIARAVDELMRKLRESNDRDLVAKAGLAELRMSQGDFLSVSRDLENITHRLPNLPRVWSNLAHVYRKMGRKDLAVNALAHAEFLDRSDYLVRNEAWEQAWEFGKTHNLDASPSYLLVSDRARLACRIYGCTREVAGDLLPDRLLEYCLPISSAMLPVAAN